MVRYHRRRGLWAGGMERPPVFYFREGLSPKERVVLRTTRGLADVRLAAMLVWLVCDIC